MTIALKTVNYLDKEKEFIPWKASLRELGYVDSMLERTALYGPFSVSYIYFHYLTCSKETLFSNIYPKHPYSRYFDTFLKKKNDF